MPRSSVRPCSTWRSSMGQARSGRGGYLGHVLLGSVIGAGLGLVLLALGLALILNALERRDEGAVKPASEPRPQQEAPQDQTFRDQTLQDHGQEPSAPSGDSAYPQLEAGPGLVLPQASEPLPPTVSSQWRSIFEEEGQAAPTSAPNAPPVSVQTPRPARPAVRPATPRERPQPQKQDDSLFF